MNTCGRVGIAVLALQMAACAGPPAVATPSTTAGSPHTTQVATMGNLANLTTSTRAATQSPNPSSTVAASPAYFQLVQSASRGYSVAIPAKWRFVSADGAVSPAVQEASLAKAFREQAALIRAQVGRLDPVLHVAMFDPASGATPDRIAGFVGVDVPVPNGDIGRLRGSVGRLLESRLTLASLTSEAGQLPAGAHHPIPGRIRGLVRRNAVGRRWGRCCPTCLLSGEQLPIGRLGGALGRLPHDGSDTPGESSSVSGLISMPAADSAKRLPRSGRPWRRRR